VSAARRAVYTALIGKYEKLQDQQVAAQSGLPFICFTDDPSLTSDTWEVRVIEPAIANDPVRSARRLKVLGHDSLADFDETLWIDNRVQLTARPEDVLDAWLENSDFTVPAHSYRRSIADEFAAVLEGGFDDPTMIQNQVLRYANIAPCVLDDQPLWTGILARRTGAVQPTMDAWFAEIAQYSRRDQLSITFALHQSGQSARSLVANNIESEWHRWPRLEARLERTPRSAIDPGLPAEARLSLATARAEQLPRHPFGKNARLPLVIELRASIDSDWIALGTPKSSTLAKNRRRLLAAKRTLAVPFTRRVRQWIGRILRRLKVLRPLEQ
jgi:Protein of unknown function (DUF616)